MARPASKNVSRSQLVRVSLVVAAAAAALTLLLYPTDEKRVREAVEALIAGANEGGATLDQALLDYAVPHVSVNVAELPAPLKGRAAVSSAVERARAFGVAQRFRAEAIEVTVEGTRARVNADVVPALAQASIAPRHTVATFQAQEGRFLLVSAEVGPTRRDEPEERP